MGGSGTKYINYGKTIVFSERGVITCQIHGSDQFRDYRVSVLSVDNVINDHPNHKLVVIKYNKGNLESLTHYYKGKKHGRATEYEDVAVAREMMYVEGKINGICVDNKLKLITNYRNGLKHGLQEEGYPNGHYKRLSTYKDDKLDGPETIFHENKNAFMETTYKDGLKHGEYKEYNQAGVLVRKWMYKDGKLHGNCISYNNGKITYECEYKDGVIDGVEIDRNVVFSPDTAVRRTVYKNGIKEGDNKEFYANGNVKFEVQCKNDKFHGKCIHYYPSGRVESVGNYTDGLQDGEFKYYTETRKHVKTQMFSKGFPIKCVYHDRNELDLMLYNTSQNNRSTLQYSPYGQADKFTRPAYVEYQPSEENLKSATRKKSKGVAKENNQDPEEGNPILMMD